jgi:hypothetical protein
LPALEGFLTVLLFLEAVTTAPSPFKQKQNYTVMFHL